MRSTSFVVLLLLVIGTAIVGTTVGDSGEGPASSGSDGPDVTNRARTDRKAPHLLGAGHVDDDRTAVVSVPEDPWQPQPARHVAGQSLQIDTVTTIDDRTSTIHRVRTGTDGDLRIVRELCLGEDVEPESAAIYDIRGLLTAKVFDGHALAGHDHEAPFPGAPRNTWLRLLKAAADALGRSVWQGDAHLLAWDETHELILARLPEPELAMLEAEFDRWSSRQASVVPVRVRYANRNGKFENGVLAVDVPWGVPVRAWDGTTWTYLQDFDLEVGNGGGILSDPIWGEVETGYELAATRVPTRAHPDGELVLRVVHTVGPPRFEAYRTRLADFAVITIEIPQTRLVHWGTRLPDAEPRTWEVPLGDEGRLQIEVGAVTSPPGRFQRAWRRLEGAPAAATKGEECELVLELHGTRSGALGRDTMSLSGALERTCALLQASSPGWLDLQRSRKQEAGDGSYALDSHVAGRVRVDVAAVDRRDRPTRMDVTISAAAWTGKSRAVQILVGPQARHLDGRVVDVPSSRTMCVSRRLGLSPRGEGTLTFRGDLGRGWEDLTLSVWRSADR